jgi:hypothetical protein
MANAVITVAVAETLVPNCAASRGSIGSMMRNARPPLALASARRMIVSRTCADPWVNRGKDWTMASNAPAGLIWVNALELREPNGHAKVPPVPGSSPVLGWGCESQTFIL